MSRTGDSRVEKIKGEVGSHGEYKGPASVLQKMKKHGAEGEPPHRAPHPGSWALGWEAVGQPHPHVLITPPAGVTRCIPLCDPSSEGYPEGIF